MTLSCSCPRFSKNHYPIKRKGLHGTSGLGIILPLLNPAENDVKLVRELFQQMNLRAHTLPAIHSLDQLETILNELAQGRNCSHNMQISGKDSIFAVSILSEGNDKVTLLPDGHVISDVDIERYFDQCHCPILRGKPKLHFYHKDWLDPESYPSSPIQITPIITPDTSVIDNNAVWTTTSSNTLAFYTFGYGTAVPRTIDSGYLVLSRLLAAYNQYGGDQDLVSFLTKFNDEISESINILPRGSACPCMIGRDRLRCYLYFLKPRQNSFEEQESELYNSFQTFEITPQSLSPQLDFPAIRGEDIPVTIYGEKRGDANRKKLPDHRSRPVYWSIPPPITGIFSAISVFKPIH